jgi:hypothetical protein
MLFPRFHPDWTYKNVPPYTMAGFTFSKASLKLNQPDFLLRLGKAFTLHNTGLTLSPVRCAAELLVSRIALI